MTGIEMYAVELRARCASTGTFAVDDLAFVKDCLGLSLTPFTLIAVLRLALDVPVLLLRSVENWEGASDGGDMSTDEVVALVNRWWVTSGGHRQ